MILTDPRTNGEIASVVGASVVSDMISAYSPMAEFTTVAASPSMTTYEVNLVSRNTEGTGIDHTVRQNPIKLWNPLTIADNGATSLQVAQEAMALAITNAASDFSTYVLAHALGARQTPLEDDASGVHGGTLLGAIYLNLLGLDPTLTWPTSSKAPGLTVALGNRGVGTKLRAADCLFTIANGRINWGKLGIFSSPIPPTYTPPTAANPNETGLRSPGGGFTGWASFNETYFAPSAVDFKATVNRIFAILGTRKVYPTSAYMNAETQDFVFQQYADNRQNSSEALNLVPKFWNNPVQPSVHVIVKPAPMIPPGMILFLSKGSPAIQSIMNPNTIMLSAMSRKIIEQDRDYMQLGLSYDMNYRGGATTGALLVL